MSPLEPSRVSIVVVNHDAVATLPRTLAALRSDPELDVVVVDNASTDGSHLLVETPHRLVRLSRNEGFARGSNEGFARTDAPLVLFLNPDAIAEPPAIRHLASVLEAHPDIAAVGPRIVGEDGAVQPHCARRCPRLPAFVFQITGLARHYPASPLFGTLFDRGEGSRDVEALSGSCMMVRRSAIEALGDPGRAFDERFFLGGEDIDLCLRLGRAGWRIRYEDDVTCVHVGGHSMRQAVPLSMLEGHRSWVLLLAKQRGPLIGAVAWLIALLAGLVQVPLWLGAALGVSGAARAERLDRARGAAYVVAWALGLKRSAARGA